MANASEAKVIYLQSHPAWAAARRQERERRAAMRRHPTYLARRYAAGAKAVPAVREFKVYSNGDTPA